MVYHISKLGGQLTMPLMINDIFVINGYELKYIGEYNGLKDVPRGLSGVVFRIKGTGLVYARHSKSSMPLETGANAIVEMITSDKGVITRQKSSKDIFKADILPSDNYLKVLLKELINSLEIDLRDLRHKFSNDNHLNNMRRLVVKPGNLTYEKFVEWLDILGYKTEILVYKSDTNQKV